MDRESGLGPNRAGLGAELNWPWRCARSVGKSVPSPAWNGFETFDPVRLDLPLRVPFPLGTDPDTEVVSRRGGTCEGPGRGLRGQRTVRDLRTPPPICPLLGPKSNREPLQDVRLAPVRVSLGVVIPLVHDPHSELVSCLFVAARDSGVAFAVNELFENGERLLQIIRLWIPSPTGHAFQAFDPAPGRVLPWRVVSSLVKDPASEVVSALSIVVRHFGVAFARYKLFETRESLLPSGSK